MVAYLERDEAARYYAPVVNLYGWSPDGRYLIFLAGPQPLHARIAEIGGDTTPFYDGEDVLATSALWVDETRYVYAAVRDESRTLYLGEVGGGNAALATVPGRSLPYDVAY
jgi:hypothetical protein